MEDQKHTAESIMELINSLPIMERIKLHDLFKGVQSSSSDMEEYLTEQRFSGGRVCPICGGTHVQRNGKRKNGAQKFICKDCGKTFSIRKNTIFNGTRKSLSVWREYMSCMAEGLTIDQSAERCGITHYTSFIWRHKILDALGECSRDTELSGIVEADETFMPLSFKGDRSLFSKGEVERQARVRGGENHKRGLSDELVCIPCAIDRKGNAVSRVAKLGKCSTKAVREVLGGHVNHEATLCTDEEASYRKFAKENGNALVQIKGGKGTVKGIYHIQHLNAYHSNLKNFIGQFKGISSKYLNNYLVWNNEVERRKNGFAEKAVAVLQQVASAIFEETCSALFLRPAVPLLVKNQS